MPSESTAVTLTRVLPSARASRVVQSPQMAQSPHD